MKKSPSRGAVWSDELRRKAVQMGLVAGRDLENGGLRLDKARGLEMTPQRADGPRARRKTRTTVGMAVF
jgi:hypothetical protein